MKTYAIETKNKVEYVTASSRSAAVNKIVGISEKAAIEYGMILSVNICK